MDLKRLAAAAAAIATSIGLPILAGEAMPASAAPLDPPPADPGGPVGGPEEPPPPPPHGNPGLQPYTPRPPVMRVGPGGPKGGGGQPSYEQPRHRTPPPPPPG